MKKFIAIILCLILTFSLVACGNTPPEEMTKPTETPTTHDKDDDPTSGPAAVVGEVNQINKFKLNGKVYTVDDLTLDVINELGYKTDNGVWTFMSGGISLGGKTISNGKTSIKYNVDGESKNVIVIGFDSSSPDVELYSQTKIGMSKSDFVKKIKGMETKLVEWMDDEYFCIVYSDNASMIAKIEKSKVTTVYLAINDKCGITKDDGKINVDAINKQYFEEQYSQNKHEEWNSYGSAVKNDFDTTIKLMNKEFKFEELKYSDLISLGYNPTNSLHNYNGVMMFREFVHENGSSLLVIDNKDGLVEALMIKRVPGIEDMDYEKGKINCDLTICGVIKAGAQSKDCEEALEIDVDVESMLAKTELIGENGYCLISHSEGIVDDILLINRTIFPPVESEPTDATEAPQNDN